MSLTTTPSATSPTPPAPSRRTRRRFRLRALLAAGSAVGLGAVLTLAQFTDQGDVTATFSTGSVDIAFDGTNEGTPTPYAFTSLSLTAAKPGSAVAAPLVVNNKGTLPFTYAMTTTVGTGAGVPLASALQITIVQGATTCAADGTVTGGTPVLPQTTGLANATVTGRSLAAGGQETLCFRVALPTSATSTVSGLSTTATFAFTATQA